MLIAIDLDGVVRDFLTHLGYPQDKLAGYWDIFSALDEAESLALKARAREKGFAASAPVLEDAKKWVQNAQRVGHEIVALTAPMGGSVTWHADTETWLARNGLEVPAVHCPTKLKRYFSADMLIEDNPETALAWARTNPRGNAILLDRPWNHLQVASLPTRANLLVVQELSEVVPL